MPATTHEVAARAYPVPRDEAERILEVRQLELLDTPREPLFDGVVQNAAATFQAPMAAIAIVDEERVWFKAEVGVPFREIARWNTFCAHVIVGVHTMVVPDATQDGRFRNNSLVLEEPRIRFFAGVPLVSHLGHRLGALCVLDTRPRTVSSERLRKLESLAAMTALALEARRASPPPPESERRLFVF